MRLLIAPDSFKQSLTAQRAAEAIARGARRAAADARVDLCPVADGGEGTVAALVAATGGQLRQARVAGPLGRPVTATWGLLGQGDRPQACIEIAEAAGLHLVPADRRDPTRTTTYGVGELITAALDAGCGRIIVGLGGSATTDGGAGMAQALGVSFRFASPPTGGIEGASQRRRGAAGQAGAGGDPNHPHPSPPPGGEGAITGGGLTAILSVDLTTRDPRLDGCEVVAACDVTNPLLGPNGSAAVYGPQKGATPTQVEQLDAALAHLASVVGVDPQQPGYGAAGGLGFGLSVFCGATLQRGVDMVLDAVDFDRRCEQADLVITGEGRLDGQSMQGKVCMGVAARAAAKGVPTIALVGSAGDDAAACLDHGLAAYHTLVDEAGGVERAIADAEPLLAALAERVIRSR